MGMVEEQGKGIHATRSLLANNCMGVHLYPPAPRPLKQAEVLHSSRISEHVHNLNMDTP